MSATTTIPQDRRVWQYTQIGDLPSVLHQTTLPLPISNKKNDKGILIKVAACGLNPVDTKVVDPNVILRHLSKKPGVPGMEYSGIVVGGDLEGTEFKIGMPVYGMNTDFLGVRVYFGSEWQ